MNKNLMSLALLGIAGAGLFMIMKGRKSTIIPEGTVHDNDSETPASTPIKYEQAQEDWRTRLQPTTASDGSKIFQPLDTSPTNPLKDYQAIVRTKMIVPKYTVGKPAQPAGVIFLYNTKTGREAQLNEFASKLNAAEKDTLTKTFIHAFNYACKVNSNYDAWSDTFLVASAVRNCDVFFNVSL